MEQTMTVTPGTTITVILDGVTEQEATDTLVFRKGLTRRNELLVSAENADGTYRVQVLSTSACRTCGGRGTS